jgi:hypothetical protein
VGHVARKREIGNAYKIFVRKPERKRQLGRSRHRWESNILLDLREIGWKDVVCMHLAWDRAVMNTL